MTSGAEPDRDARSELDPNDSLTDMQAVIESAKARGGIDALERYIRKRLPEAEEAEVKEAAEVAVEIIESIPVFPSPASWTTPTCSFDFSSTWSRDRSRSWTGTWTTRPSSYEAWWVRKLPDVSMRLRWMRCSRYPRI
jgi:hypothetical protein